MKTISSLKPGQKACITIITATDSLRQRLFDLGLTPGTLVEMVKFAPLGDPLEIKLRGYRLTLRKSEANFAIIEEANND
ncbi:MAG TPA: ferrous iron transport protein A [Bacilli bacterium]|nr:ferrous iron transport protein A [Bacilli bacterium]